MEDSSGRLHKCTKLKYTHARNNVPTSFLAAMVWRPIKAMKQVDAFPNFTSTRTTTPAPAPAEQLHPL
eukprot:1158730-Pelagomonas_calceolata.AAC.4